MSCRNKCTMRITAIVLGAFLMIGFARGQQPPTAASVTTMTPPAPSCLSEEEATIRAAELALILARVGEEIHGGGGYLDSQAPAIPGMPIETCPRPYIILGILSPLSGTQEIGDLPQSRISQIGET